MISNNNETIYVLIVDDEKELCTDFHDILMEISDRLEITSVFSSLDALEKLKTQKFDVMVTDIRMPEMDGLALMEKANSIQEGLQTIIITGHGDIDNAIRAMRLGALNFYKKPVDIQALYLGIIKAWEKKVLHLRFMESVDALKESHEMLEKRVMERTAELEKSKIEAEIANQSNVELNDYLYSLNEKISKLNAELQELNTTKDKFFSIIAHDMRNAFTPIMSYTGMLSRMINDCENPKKTRIVNRLFSVVQNAYKLMENLLNWSRIQIDAVKCKPEKILLHSAVIHNLSFVSELAQQKKITLTLSIPKEYTIYADKNILDTIFRNLIGNAIKYTGTDGKVDIAACKLEKDIEVCVSDTGIGIDKDVLSKLFRIDEKNIQTGTNGERGTGLGLIICKDLISRINGSIRVESQLGQGSSFYIRLPQMETNDV
ncbi:response regulator receiver sensor signal transduction histidine kinase [Candidatus Magnetomorum sp. HK-1]|nr:response regulator receiver sensor signal transduction histidine kinase [Candidatus Magnetomorum sp. HK-1]